MSEWGLGWKGVGEGDLVEEERLMRLRVSEVFLSFKIYKFLGDIFL